MPHLARLYSGNQFIREVSIAFKQVSRTTSDACEKVGFKAVWVEDLCNPPREPRDNEGITAFVIDGQLFNARSYKSTCNECKQFFVAELFQSLFDNSEEFGLKICTREPGCEWVIKHIDTGVPIFGGLTLDSRELQGDLSYSNYVCKYRFQTDAFNVICEYDGEVLLCRKSDGQTFKVEEIKPSEPCPSIILSKTKAEYLEPRDGSYEVFN